MRTSTFCLASVGLLCQTGHVAAYGQFAAHASRSALYRAGQAPRVRLAEVSRSRRTHAGINRQLLTCKAVVPQAYSSEDWVEQMLSLPHSKLLYQIRSHLTFNTLWAVLISIVHEVTPQHLIQSMHISTVPHSIMASAMGLLLVFRNNAAYDRFWEARKVWGAVTNQVRNLARLSHISLAPDPVIHDAMLEYVKSFPWLLKQHLQADRVDEEIAFLKLPAEEIEYIQTRPNPPLRVCERMSQLLQDYYGPAGVARQDLTSVFYRNQIEDAVNHLIDYLGMCERILGTPVPRKYSRHTSRFLTVYLATLPIVLVPQLEWMTGPVVFAICWGLLSIEAIAFAIEQPFCKRFEGLPLETYATRMCADIGRMAEVPPVLPVLTGSTENTVPAFAPANGVNGALNGASANGAANGAAVNGAVNGAAVNGAAAPNGNANGSSYPQRANLPLMPRRSQPANK